MIMTKEEFEKSRLVDKFTMGGQTIEIWIMLGRLQIRMPDIGKIHSIDLPSDLAIVEKNDQIPESPKDNIFKILSDLPVDKDTKWLFSFILTYLFNLSADELKLKEDVEKLRCISMIGKG